jgi:hypothetical protein
MRTSKILLWTLLLLQLAACNLPAPQKRDDADSASAANFLVTEAKGDATLDNLGADFAVPKSRTFSFSVCVADRARSQALISQNFRVNEIEKEIKTDQKGCLNWAEAVPFNFFGEPKYLAWTRTITATGVYRGSRTVRFAINPWNMIDRSAPVLNLDITSAANLVTDPEEVKKALSAEATSETTKDSWFTLAPLEFKFIKITRDNTSDREILFNTKACIRSGAITKNLRNFKFNVTGFYKDGDSPGQQQTVSPDNSGCLNWDDKIDFKYYGCQKYFKGTVAIESPDLHIRQSLQIAINPWESLGTSFARDLRFVNDKELILKDCKQANMLPSNLWLSNYNYTTLSYDYAIDKYLNLTVKKKIRFKADARVVTFSDMAKGRMEGAQKIRPGVYLLKLALIKNRDYYNDKTYVTSAETLISTLDGDIRADIELSTADLKSIGNRNSLLIELNPVKESKVRVDSDGKVAVKEAVSTLDDLIDNNTGLQTRTFGGVMTLAFDKDAQELTPLDAKSLNQYMVNAELPPKKGNSVIREYINLGKKIEAENLKSLQTQSNVDDFAKVNSLQIIKAKDGVLWDTKTLTQFAETGKITPPMSLALCNYWFKNLMAKDIMPHYARSAFMARLVVDCAKSLQNEKPMIQAEKKLFVKEIGAYNFIRGMPMQNMSVGNGVILQHTHTVSDTHTQNWNFTAGLSEKFANFFSIGFSTNYNIAHAVADAVVHNSNATINANTYILTEENVFQVEFKRYEECSVLRINPTFFVDNRFGQILQPKYSEKEKIDAIAKGLMICTGEVKQTPVTRNESYFLLYQSTTASQMQDIGDARNRNLFIAIRGQKDFHRLMSIMSAQPAEAMTKNPLQPQSVYDLEALFMAGLPTIPGSYND